MSRWKGLPETLDHRVRQLVVQLRRLKDHSGLSLASLAAKTAYSKSSWERYLNGKKLPPREAVEALARVCGADATRLLVLHEVAAQAWGAERAGQPRAPEPTEGGAAAAPEEDAPATPAPAEDAPATPAPAPAPSVAPAPVAVPGRSWLRGGPLALLGGLVVVAVAAVVLLAVRPWQDDGGGGRGTGTASAGRTTAATPAFRHRVGETFRCHVRRTAGGLTADRSRSTTAILSGGVTGWEVVEAQCLLNHHGYDPGPVDGIVGEHTMRAVKRLQAAAGLPTDGVVGPDTWKVLRR
ncbi:MULTISPECIES: peptidoglycan-binding protein [Streptomyces]|uniref:Peptidoglycan-binding protein n=1 Tax=Streptomyces siderophoricus TaxID=2802281 RepID=A0ABS1MVJ3_9ACTN|nr:peptidoglycan-binding protein [Streptomyces sp. 9-7]MBL1091797.1 peptidoglycan-binding protein [Streptomyces sp. 9-7]